MSNTNYASQLLLSLTKTTKDKKKWVEKVNKKLTHSIKLYMSKNQGPIVSNEGIKH